MTDKAKPAAGLTALHVTWKHARAQTGAFRALRVLTQANQATGFDCPGCAWPDPEERSTFEFCENGAKAILDEATTKRVGPAFFAEHSIDALFEKEESWLNAQGRLIAPMVREAGASHYRPTSYEAAYELIADELAALPSPDAAAFYTSGRTSNEAAFLYQLLARAFGTNNLPDCSNLCHESSGVALKETLGIGKGTVRLSDFKEADLILVIGQNPGTNHPRMLSALREAKLGGTSIVSINPLVEQGLVRFSHPQEIEDLLGDGVSLADEFVRVRINGDQALFRGLCKYLVTRGEDSLDMPFIREFTTGFDAFRTIALGTSWSEIEVQSGVSRQQIEALGRRVEKSKSILCSWAMGLTQHENAVVTIQEVTNFLLLRGNMGRPGAGACPVRGHSNVQGDRSMGIVPELPFEFARNMEHRFGIRVPEGRGLDTVGTITSLGSKSVRALICLGGNFLSASPDTHVTEQALRGARLTVHVSTKLNKSHFAPGEIALILPCLGRSEREDEADRFVSVENSMGIVHSSRGNLPPADPGLRSEPRIVAQLAQAILARKSGSEGSNPALPFDTWAKDYDAIREVIGEVVPGFENYNERVRAPLGFELENGPRERKFNTPSQKAVFISAPLRTVVAQPGELILMTIRSHDQFNTTVYSNEDRYRGIKGSRKVLLVSPDDLKERGLRAGQALRITSLLGGEEPGSPEQTRTLDGFLAHPYDLPRGTAAAYFPEANPLIFLTSFAERSFTPTSKSVRITIEAFKPD